MCVPLSAEIECHSSLIRSHGTSWDHFSQPTYMAVQHSQSYYELLPLVIYVAKCSTSKTYVLLVCGHFIAIIFFVCLQNQCTPLYQAAQNGHSNTVKLLIDENAEVDCICKVNS